MNYDIIASGSGGNAVVIEGSVMIDCGVAFKRLAEHMRGLKLVLLSHVHSDHFNRAAIKRLAFERPGLRWACGVWLAQDLLDCGVKRRNIDVLFGGRRYDFGICEAEPFELRHDVRNFGWKLYLPSGERLIYATDTGSLEGVEAKDFELYLIEANHAEGEIAGRIADKLRRGEYAYELGARENHLSREQADEFIYGNIGKNGAYVYMHGHEGLAL